METIITPFKQNEIATQFLTNGFCTIDLLHAGQLDKINNIYHEINKEKLFEKPQFFGVNYSVASLDKSVSETVVKIILPLIKDRLDEVFTDYEVFGTLFINKPAKTDYGFDYHQDWSYTDESKYAFATGWLPLIDVDEKNGTMSFIKGSHNFFKTYRSENLDSVRFPMEEIPNSLRDNVSLKRGQCLFFHPAILHGSFPNSTDNPRPVLGFGIKPRSAPLYHYLKGQENIDVLDIPVAEFNNFIVSVANRVFPEGVELKKTIADDNYVPKLHEIIEKWLVKRKINLIFKDNEHKEKYLKEGFVYLKNVIPLDIINTLLRYYESNFKTRKGMYVTHHNCTDVLKNKEISEYIFDKIEPFIVEFLGEFKKVISHFAVKSSQSNNPFNMHQDWSIIDETKFDIAHLWIPLCDANSKNGTLCVIPGSHLLFQNYRSGSCGIRFTDINLYKDVIIEIEAKKGDIIAYHPAIFHGSGPNHSDNDRIATIASICHKDAQLTYFHKERDNVCSYDLLETDLFGRLAELAEGKDPAGDKLGIVPNNILSIGDRELEHKLKNNNK